MKKLIFVLIAGLALFSCSKADEISLEEAQYLNVEGLEEILAKTVSKPWRGEDFIPGRLGGTWNARVQADPKTFNIIVAEGDAPSASILNAMLDYFLDYNVVTREWEPRCVSYEIIVNEAAGTLTVIYTLRDDLYWNYYNSDRRVKVTSDDIIFWYNVLETDAELQMSGYNSQFILMEDGSEARIEIEKIDDRRFAYHFPRIVAEPLLYTNTTIAPRMEYEEAYRIGGADAVLSILDVQTDPRSIPSMGQWFLVEYSPGQRLVYERNPNYWKKDTNGISIPYYERRIVRIIPDTNTAKLLFLQGELESYGVRSEDLDELVNNAGHDYTVYNAEGAFSSSFWTFNQNPVNADEPWYEWFSQKEFRQAMSCLLNRDRISTQVYRGLAEPKYDIFPEPNPFYNSMLTLDYRFNRARAISLLASIGIKQDSAGIMRDSKGRAIEFDLAFESDATVYTDMATIIMDELSRVGIKLNIRVIEFNKLIEMLTRTYDWASIFIRLGVNLFPSQGSNVWPSDGNLHMWYPLQDSPATEWEARLDYLYNEGCFTIDPVKAKSYWDEFQEILLEQCPIIYLMRQRTFLAISNRWDMSNVYYDNRNDIEVSHIFMAQ